MRLASIKVSIISRERVGVHRLPYLDFNQGRYKALEGIARNVSRPDPQSRTLEARGRDRGIDNRDFVIQCHQRNRFSVLVASSTNTTPRPGTSVSPNKAPDPGGLPVLSNSTLNI
jgi:hypothetical protein